MKWILLGAVGLLSACGVETQTPVEPDKPPLPEDEELLERIDGAFGGFSPQTVGTGVEWRDVEPAAHGELEVWIQAVEGADSNLLQVLVAGPPGGFGETPAACAATFFIAWNDGLNSAELGVGRTADSAQSPVQIAAAASASPSWRDSEQRVFEIGVLGAAPGRFALLSRLPTGGECGATRWGDVELTGAVTDALEILVDAEPVPALVHGTPAPAGGVIALRSVGLGGAEGSVSASRSGAPTPILAACDHEVFVRSDGNPGTWALTVGDTGTTDIQIANPMWFGTNNPPGTNPHVVDGAFGAGDGSTDCESFGEWAGIAPAPGVYTDLFVDYSAGRLHLLNDWHHRDNAPIDATCFNEFLAGAGGFEWTIRVYGDHHVDVERNGLTVDPEVLGAEGASGFGPSPFNLTPHAIWELSWPVDPGTWWVQLKDPGPTFDCSQLDREPKVISGVALQGGGTSVEHGRGPVVQGMDAGPLTLLVGEGQSLAGESFGEATGRVLLDWSRELDVQSWSDDEVRIEIPSDASGTELIIVTAEGRPSDAIDVVLEDSSPADDDDAADDDDFANDDDSFWDDDDSDKQPDDDDTTDDDDIDDDDSGHGPDDDDSSHP